MKGFGTNERVLIEVLSQLDPLQMASLRQTYSQRFMHTLSSEIESETSSYFKEGLTALVRGPLANDVMNLEKALKGAGTKETVLDDVLLGRSNADMNAIKQAYQLKYRRSLEADVRGDLSAKTERLFMMILSAQRQEESTPIVPQMIDQDVAELHRATEGRAGADQLTVCQIFSNRSDGQLRTIAQVYERKYQIPLEKVIIKVSTDFSHCGHTMFIVILHLADRNCFIRSSVVTWRTPWSQCSGAALIGHCATQCY